MNKLISLLVLLGTLFSVPAWGQVLLQIPKDFDLLLVNGKKVSNVRASVSLPDGMNQLVFRLVKNVGKRTDPSFEYSDVFVVKFSAGHAQLHFEYPPVRRAADIRSFDRNPKVTLVGSSGRTVAMEIDKLKKEGLQLFRDYEKEIRAFNETDSPAAAASLNDPEKVKPATPPVSPEPVAASQNDNTPAPVTARQDSGDKAEEMLRYWYEHADEKTRQEFLKRAVLESLNKQK